MQKRQYTAGNVVPYPIVAHVLQIGTYSALIGDQALFCSSKISKAVPSVFSSSALHYSLPRAHCDVHMYWGLIAVFRLSSPIPLDTYCTLHVVRSCQSQAPILQPKSAHSAQICCHGSLLIRDQASYLAAHYDDDTSNRVPATCLKTHCPAGLSLPSSPTCCQHQQSSCPTSPHIDNICSADSSQSCCTKTCKQEPCLLYRL